MFKVPDNGIRHYIKFILKIVYNVSSLKALCCKMGQCLSSGELDMKESTILWSAWQYYTQTLL
jgi:hypothetical protein